MKPIPTFDSGLIVEKLSEVGVAIGYTAVLLAAVGFIPYVVLTFIKAKLK